VNLKEGFEEIWYGRRVPLLAKPVMIWVEWLHICFKLRIFFNPIPKKV